MVELPTFNYFSVYKPIPRIRTVYIFYVVVIATCLYANSFVFYRVALENSLFLVGIGTKQPIGRSVNKNKNKTKNIFLFGTSEQEGSRLVTRNMCKRKSRHILAEDLLKITQRI